MQQLCGPAACSRPAHLKPDQGRNRAWIGPMQQRVAQPGPCQGLGLPSGLGSHLQHAAHRSVPKRALWQTPATAASEGASGQGSNGPPAAGPVMVWFKADLRVDDHEGLIQAAQQAGSAGLIPLYCLDPAQLHHLAFLPAGPEVLVATLQELRAALRACGSDLVVVRGRWQEAVPAAARRWGARMMVAQHEVEHMLGDPADTVFNALRSTGVAVQQWDAHIWPPSGFRHNFREWRATRPRPQPAMSAPATLPPLPAACTDTGELPDASELRSLLASDPPTHLHEEAALRQEVEPTLADARTGPAARRQQRLISAGRDWLQRLAVYLSLRESDIIRTADAGRSSSSSNGGAGHSRDDLEAVLKEGVVANETPAAEGASFPALFAVALALGALSRRRVYEKAMSAGGMSSLTCRAAALTAESADFHWQLSQRNDKRPPGVPANVQFRHWRWNGFITDYMVSEPPADKALPEDAPAVLLLHGFGAFGDHWRDNLSELAAAGYRVYAPTLPGFGRSEKGAVPYSQVLWGNFLRDFVVQVVGSQVVLAGNSIGGFIAAGMAADHPSIVKGLVLLNSAGPIDGAFSMGQWEREAAARKPPPKWVVKAVSGSLFWYLERTVPGTLAWLYPTAPERAKGWLPDEICRAAADMGAVEVFGSVFYLPPPRALNYLIKDCYRGPTLVLQGILDPLNDSKGRAAQLKSLVPGQVEVKELQAGHCPHDEVPHEVNQALMEWIQRVVYKPQGAAVPA